MRNGIKLLLEPGTRIQNWIRYQTLNVEIGRKSLNGRNTRFIKIRKGKAAFLPDGSVEVKMPSSAEFRVAFQPREVLEIRDLKGNLIERNHYLCTKCATLTGEMESYEQSIVVTGRVDAKFKCAQCGHQWELRI
jgi:hypothetical protein